MIMKFIIIGNACMSSNFDAKAIPIAVNRQAIKNMNKRAKGRNKKFGLNPAISVKMKTINPCSIAMVAPPRVLPIIM